jgi:serine/threonine protein kinase
MRMVQLSQLVEASRMREVEAALADWRAATGPMPEACVRSLVDGALLTEWQIDRLRHRKTRGFFLGKCKLLQPLGRGGMGSVYLAEHTTLQTRVAVKVLPGTRADKKGSYLERFEQEARAAFRLNHRNVARASDLDRTEDGNHFIVLEFIDGTDLDRRVRDDGPLAVRDAAEAVRQAALGLQYAHEEGFVHRDVKPANLMIDRRGDLKILDLGLVQTDARERQDNASLTQTHEEKVVGTPDYMSPEQAQGKRVDHRSDIYSLGCTFYFLLSGHAPFEKFTGEGSGINKRQARMRAHIREPAPNVLDVRADVPPEIVELILRMMEKSPDARPQSAKEVADSLEAWLKATATSGPRDAPRRSPAARSAGSDAVVTGPPRRRTAGSETQAMVPSAQRLGDGVLESGGGADGDPGGSGSSISINLAGDRPRSRSPGGRSAESDVHAVGTSDTLKLALSGQSTGRQSAVTISSRPGDTAAPGITIDVGPAAGRPGATGSGSAAVHAAAVRPHAAGGALPPALPAGAGPAGSGKAGGVRDMLLRRTAGLPLAAWLGVAVAVVAAMVAVATFWPGGGADDPLTADEEQGLSSSSKVDPPPAPRKSSPPTPTKTVPKKSRQSPSRKPAAPPAAPSPLDTILTPKPDAAGPPAAAE